MTFSLEERPISVVAFAGSLRVGSYNRALLRVAQRVAPESMDVDVVDLRGIPLFDADVEERGDPGSVAEFKDRVARADALLVATPEYQHSVPGVLKNALDWASRPPWDPPIGGAPTAIMGATPGGLGTTRAQEHLRSILAYNACPTVARPEVLVSNAAIKVNEDGEFTDPQTLRLVAELLDGLADLTHRYARRPAA